MAYSEAKRGKLSVGKMPSHPPSSDFSVLSTPPSGNGPPSSQVNFPFRMVVSPKDEELSLKMIELLNENQDLRGWWHPHPNNSYLIVFRVISLNRQSAGQHARHEGRLFSDAEVED